MNENIHEYYVCRKEWQNNKSNDNDQIWITWAIFRLYFLFIQLFRENFRSLFELLYKLANRCHINVEIMIHKCTCTQFTLFTTLYFSEKYLINFNIEISNTHNTGRRRRNLTK